MSGEIVRVGGDHENDPHPTRDALLQYARGDRNPRLAGHISRCDSCAWIVTEAMEAEPLPFDGDFIDITPAPRNWFRRLLDRLRSFFMR